MKNLKKFAALLLAGAMALLMLTACGGGGDFGKRDPDAEDKAFNRFTSMTQASGLKENDKSLQAVAEGHLREDLNSSIEILGAKLVGKVHVEGKEKEYLTITVTGRYDYGLIVSTILNEIQSAVGKELPGTKVDVKGKGSWTKIGVVVRTDGTHHTENRRQGNLRRFSVSMGKADKKQPRTFWKARGCFCFTGSSLPQGGQARREK